MSTPTRCTTATTRSGCAACAALLLLTCAASAGDHPRLILRDAELPRIRHAVGLVADDSDAGVRFGARAAELNLLRAHFLSRKADDTLPGELLAAAWLLCVDPGGPARQPASQLVQRELAQPFNAAGDAFERVLALDWAWEHLPREARTTALRAVRERLTPLTEGDSPLDSRVFRERLAWAALALAVGDSDEFGAPWAAQRARLVDGLRGWVGGVLPAFVAWRGASPTSPAAAAREEGDVALALELASLLSDANAWEGVNVQRWMEHYLFVSGASGVDAQFLHDDGTVAPPTPLAEWGGLDAITAHLFAVRTRDPAAAWVARRVESLIVAGRSSPPRAGDELRGLWCWVPVTLSIERIAPGDPRRLPVARDLGGAIVFRDGARPDEPGRMTVWIEACQPCLRRRQHFDAGHFLIRAGGRLLNSSAEDVVFEATPSKGGAQHVGAEAAPFDFDQFCTASVAHNCLLAWESTGVIRWYGRDYLPRGGQRPIEGTLREFGGAIEQKPAWTGRKVAYGHSRGAAYAALDLRAAYEPEVVQSYTREFVFALGRVLVVIDRVALAKPGTEPISVYQIASRPTVGGADVDTLRRVAGSNAGGVWQVPDRSGPLRWTDGTGALECLPLLPASRTVTIAGGPARQRVIADGPAAGRTYVGGARDGFERLVKPASAGRHANAWYELGRPTLLGPEFGRTPIWGRLEIAGPKRQKHVVFATVLTASGAGQTGATAATLESGDGGYALTVRLADGASFRLTIPDGLRCGGRLYAGDAPGEGWPLPADVQADPPLATVAEP